ncbi:efflux transporter outer membrane subunit [Rhodohalobacter sulfatireducens]|uniref:Efflux transporter outer membrane subunit n=1 Tax=Rhodohalobacter sulfatireducens TaxID=2911366 RepID=A0ABS9KDW1_9BACT|nr:efflux transporter outer membrane subunit [Rhodohalobacter sulfatireducens]MCG2589047.1 efflux transporter outer membrane subunit [Rhodohalobacter sulfatireducens]
MPRNRLTFQLIIFLGVLLMLFSGCRTQSDLTDPIEIPESFSESGVEIVPAKWWTSFEDKRLSTVIDSAMSSNFTLLTAWERLRAAEAVVDRESSLLFPTLEATGSARADRFSDSSRDSEQLQLGLSTSYEIDLWGRIGSTIDAEQFRAQATLYDYQTAALSLTAEITRTWYRLADAQNQLALVNEQINTNLTVLELLNNRFEIGQIQSVDVLRQQQLVEATREQRTYAEARVQTLEHQLAVLLGQTPQSGVDLRPEDLPQLAPLPSAGLPTDLVQKRPDVRSAFASLRAADNDLAAAISNQYPRFSISASASTAAESAGALFEDWAVSFAGNLLAPIFYGGELRAEVDRNEAVKNQRLYEYGQTILTAFREVEDALIQEKKQVESIESIERQLELASQSYRQLRIQYLNGSGNYLDVLTALDDIQQLRRDLLTAQLTLVEYRISLYRALAGSFETEMIAENN